MLAMFSNCAHLFLIYLVERLIDAKLISDYNLFNLSASIAVTNAVFM